MRSIRSRAFVARLLLGLLLFSQAALAAAACDGGRVTPAQAIAPAAMPDMPGCHEQPARNANLCLAHCLSADQSADTPQFVVPARSGAAPLTIAVEDRASVPAAIQRRAPPRFPGPPPRILFQSFLI